MNRLLLTGIVVLMWIVTGCSNKDKAPGGILSKEKMEAVLWDIIQAERFTATFVAKDTSKNVKTENFKLYGQVFSLHGVTKDEFITSYKFYLSRPDISRVLFDSLSSRANRLREEMYKSQTPAKGDSTKPVQPVQKADSLHARFRDSLIRSAKRKRSNSPIIQPKLITPDTGKSTAPKPLVPGTGKATQPKLYTPVTGNGTQPKLFPSGEGKATQPTQIPTDAWKTTQPKRPVRPDRLRVRDSVLQRP
jgi:hypothetical protein